MKEYPTMRTGRLVLRPFTLADAPDVQRLAGDEAIAATTLRLPHPYEDGVAENWIATHQDKFEKGEFIVFAIADATEDYLIGSISLTMGKNSERAELGYWIGKDYWAQGFCTEAARALLAYGFNTMSLHRIYAHHFERNPASGRVMQKIGMTREGMLREHVKKWDKFENIVCYGILKKEWAQSNNCAAGQIACKS